MNFYWSYKAIPELSGLPNSTQREAWRACYWKLWHDWRYIVRWCILFGGVFIVAHSIVKLVLSILIHNPASRLSESAVAMISGGLAGLVSHAFTVTRIRPVLRSYFTDHHTSNGSD